MSFNVSGSIRTFIYIDLNIKKAILLSELSLSFLGLLVAIVRKMA